MAKFLFKTFAVLVVLFFVAVALSQFGIRVEPVAQHIDRWVQKFEKREPFVSFFAWFKERVPKWGQRGLSKDAIRKAFLRREETGENQAQFREPMPPPEAQRPEILGLDTQRILKPKNQESISEEDRKRLEQIFPDK